MRQVWSRGPEPLRGTPRPTRRDASHSANANAYPPALQTMPYRPLLEDLGRAKVPGPIQSARANWGCQGQSGVPEQSRVKSKKIYKNLGNPVTMCLQKKFKQYLGGNAPSGIKYYTRKPAT